MEKKEYIAPAMDVVELNGPVVLQNASAEGAPDWGVYYENRELG